MTLQKTISISILGCVLLSNLIPSSSLFTHHHHPRESRSCLNSGQVAALAFDPLDKTLVSLGAPIVTDT